MLHILIITYFQALYTIKLITMLKIIKITQILSTNLTDEVSVIFDTYIEVCLRDTSKAGIYQFSHTFHSNEI